MTGHRPGGARRTRSLQRLAHVLTGVLVLAYVYLTPAPDAAVTQAVRWLLLPALVGSGVAMWQWPRLRRLARRRSAG